MAGRKSIAQITAPSGGVSVLQRPAPPLDLTPLESDEWTTVVDGLPADWFPSSTFPLLKQFCRHSVAASRVAQLIDQEMSNDPVDVGELKMLLSMQAQETAALKAMAASMRISQQASYSARGAAGAKGSGAKRARPWETS